VTYVLVKVVHEKNIARIVWRSKWKIISCRKRR